jgi:Flp pilus assembly protein TadG
MRRVIKKETANSNDRGAVLVELALILPLLAILLLGIINMGLVVREHQVLQNAAREGARFSTLETNRMDTSDAPGTRADEIKDRVIVYLALHFADVSAGNRQTITANQEYTYDITIAGVDVGDLTIDQAFEIIIDPTPTPPKMESGSEVTVTYDRAVLIPGAPFFPFNNITITGNAVFRNLY